MFHVRSKYMLYLFFTSEFCTIDAYVAAGETAWVELDKIPGLTAGDTVVHTGDHLNAYDKVRLNTCRVW